MWRRTYTDAVFGVRVIHSSTFHLKMTYALRKDLLDKLSPQGQKTDLFKWEILRFGIFVVIRKLDNNVRAIFGS
jgi:hypothetical protein